MNTREHDLPFLVAFAFFKLGCGLVVTTAALIRNRVQALGHDYDRFWDAPLIGPVLGLAFNLETALRLWRSGRFHPLLCVLHALGWLAIGGAAVWFESW